MYVMTVGTDSLKLRFGVNGATISVANGDIIKSAGVTLDSNSGKWVLVEGVGATGDTVDHLTIVVGGDYRGSTCGYDNTGSPPDDMPPVETQYEVTDPFSTQTAVGGMIIPIDTTALFVTGVLSLSPLMVLPFLAAIAGTALVLLKFQVRRPTI